MRAKEFTFSGCRSGLRIGTKVPIAFLAQENLEILDNHGLNFLHLAAQRGCLQQMPKPLLTEANPNLPDRSGVKPRESALKNGQQPLLSPRASLVMETG
jgi:hypothetical protein